MASDYFVHFFSSHHKAFKRTRLSAIHIPESLPTDEQIEDAVMIALQKAKQPAQRFGMLFRTRPSHVTPMTDD